MSWFLLGWVSPSHQTRDGETGEKGIRDGSLPLSDVGWHGGSVAFPRASPFPSHGVSTIAYSTGGARLIYLGAVAPAFSGHVLPISSNTLCLWRINRTEEGRGGETFGDPPSYAPLLKKKVRIVGGSEKTSSTPVTLLPTGGDRGKSRTPDAWMRSFLMGTVLSEVNNGLLGKISSVGTGLPLTECKKPALCSTLPDFIPLMGISISPSHRPDNDKKAPRRFCGALFWHRRRWLTSCRPCRRRAWPGREPWARGFR